MECCLRTKPRCAGGAGAVNRYTYAERRPARAVAALGNFRSQRCRIGPPRRAACLTRPRTLSTASRASAGIAAPQRSTSHPNSGLSSCVGQLVRFALDAWMRSSRTQGEGISVQMHRPQHSSPSAAHSDNDRFLLVFLKKLPQRFVCSICTVLTILLLYV